LRNLRSPFFAVLLLFGVLLLIGVPLLSRGNLVSEQDTDEGQIVEYRSEKFGFLLQYPQKWQVLEDPRELVGVGPQDLHAVAFVPTPGSKTLVIVYIQTLTTTQTLDEYVAQQMQSLQANESKFEFSSPQPIQVSEADARATSATITGENPPRQQRVVMTIKGLRAYALSFSGPPEGHYAQTFQVMLDSFTFLQ